MASPVSDRRIFPTNLPSRADESAALADRLDGLRRLAVLHDDEATKAIVAAADDAIGEWQERERRVGHCSDALATATEEADEGRRRLETLLTVLSQLSLPPPVEPARRRRGLSDWFRSHRRTPVPISRAAPRLRPLVPLAAPDPQQAAVTDAALAADVDGTVAPTAEVVATEPPAAPPRGVDIAVRLLGPFGLLRAGASVDTRNGGRSNRVLKYLLAHHRQPVQKDRLIELFWPDADLDTVGRNLHQTIYTVRRLLRDGGPELDYILFASDAYLVNPALSFWSDVEDFEALVADGRTADADGRTVDAVRAYSRADAIYRGDYLEDSPYEEWVPGERERLRLRYVEAANRLGDLHLAAGDVDSAAEVSRRVLLHEAGDEGAHRRLIRCYAATGHRNLVVQQYRTYVASAERLYGLGPSPETTALYQSVIAG